MKRCLIGMWGVIVAALYFAAFSTSEAASFEYFGRYIYMVVLAVSIVAVALGLVRPAVTVSKTEGFSHNRRREKRG